MKKVIKLLVLLNVVALPQLLSAYTHRATNKWKNPVRVKVNLVFCSDTSKVVDPRIREDIMTGWCCTRSIRVEDFSTGKEMRTINFGDFTCTGSVITINKEGSVSLEKDVG